MERYDGKTRKDDIKKWTLIITAAVVAFVGLQVGIHFLKKANEADVVYVDMCAGLLKDEGRKMIKSAIKEVWEDTDGNGRVIVDYKQILSGETAEFDREANTYRANYGGEISVLFNGDYVLFFTLDPSAFSADTMAVKEDLSGTALWETLNTPLALYACVLNTDEEQVQMGKEVIRILKAQKAEGQESEN